VTLLAHAAALFGRKIRLMSDSNLVVVQTFGSGPEAALAKSALEDAGIDAMIQADTAGGMRPHLAWSGGGFKLLVREDDVLTAQDVLDSFDEAAAEENDT
jgi:hypothetical protein